jgi:hypothetical protein
MKYSIFGHTKLVSMSNGIDIRYVPTKSALSLVKSQKTGVFSRNQDEHCIILLQKCVIRDQHKKLV